MEEQNTNDAVATYRQDQTPTVPGFATKDAWELAQRQAKALMASSMVPKAYQTNMGDCIIALDMAYRMGASPLMVMQNLYVVHGNPGWSSKFLIATFNNCGRFTSIKYEWNADRTSCRAWSTEKATNERVEGITVNMAMAQAEGWSTKAGSKWKTMPELMLQYRAAAFLIRTCAPELSMGLQTVEEVHDVEVVSSRPLAPKTMRLTAPQMEQAKAEIENAVTTAELIAEKFPHLDPEQLAELHDVTFNSAAQ
ncbi:MAG: hypothetical protein WAT41_14470 [Flavobacteriales bacterium]